MSLGQTSLLLLALGWPPPSLPWFGSRLPRLADWALVGLSRRDETVSFDGFHKEAPRAGGSDQGDSQATGTLAFHQRHAHGVAGFDLVEEGSHLWIVFSGFLLLQRHELLLGQRLKRVNLDRHLFPLLAA